MLETIKQAIAEVPDITFNEYYQHYVMQVQDSNISYEVSTIRQQLYLEAKVLADIGCLIDETYGGLVTK